MRLTLPRRRRGSGALTGSRPGGGHGFPWSQPRMVPVMRRMIAMIDRARRIGRRARLPAHWREERLRVPPVGLPDRRADPALPSGPRSGRCSPEGQDRRVRP